MVQVNSQYIRDNIVKLEKLLDEYQTTQDNIFLQLKNSCISWQDGNSVIFDSKMKEEKVESEFFYELLVNRKKLFSSIYYYYNDFGDKLRCNLANRTSCIKSAEKCRDDCNNLLTAIDNIGYNISAVRNNVNSALSRLTKAHNSVVKNFDTVRLNETNILNLIRKIDDILIKEFEFNFIVVDHDLSNQLDFSAIQKDLELLKSYSGQEEEEFGLIFSKYFDLSNDYKSNNTGELNSSIDTLKTAAELLINKRLKYIETLTTNYNNYKTGSKESSEIIDREV